MQTRAINFRGDKKSSTQNLFHLLAHYVWAGLYTDAAFFPAHDLYKAPSKISAIRSLVLGGLFPGF